MVERMKSKALLFPALAGAMTAGSTVVAFATGADTGAAGGLPSFSITTEMLTPLVEGVMANIQVILPVGLGLFAIFLGIRIIPGLVSRFIRM